MLAVKLKEEARAGLDLEPTDAGVADGRVLQVSAAVDGAAIVYWSFSVRPGWHLIGGTSEASPLFAGVPGLKSPDQITLLEEEKVMAYYGGGSLYGAPGRGECHLAGSAI